jgi:cytochrome c oxidase assembly protein subunit 15
MQAERTHPARPLAFELSPSLFRTVAFAAVGALYAIVATGALVRLTASGLGCESWPGCTSGNPFPEKDYHAFVEFGNRVFGLIPISLTILTAIAARRTPGLPRWTVRLAAAVAIGTLAQAPLGYITVEVDLHPIAVMSHLLLAFLVLAGGVVVAIEALGLTRGRAEPLVPRELRIAGVVLAGACLALVTSGAFVTAAGPHSGGDDIRRLGSLPDALWVHIRATALFGCAFLFVLGYLAARRAETGRLLWVMLGVLALVLVQMSIGEIQYRTELPWLLVLVHVSLAAGIWAGTVTLAALFFRPPALIARSEPSGVDFQAGRPVVSDGRRGRAPAT